MAAKRILMVCALAMIFGSTGCRSWCEHHYPCASPQQPCQPCYQQPVSYGPPAAPWSGGAPGTQLNCTCTQR